MRISMAKLFKPWNGKDFHKIKMSFKELSPVTNIGFSLRHKGKGGIGVGDKKIKINGT